jgi:DNA polymerase-1
MRRKAKEVNFGIVYGLTAFGLSERIGVPHREAKDFIERTFERYTGVRAFIASLLEGARKSGFVSTMLGRRRYVRDVTSQNGMLRQAAERVAVNAPIQGSAADIMKRAMIKVDGAMSKLKARMILQVHDELVIETPKKEIAAVRDLLRDGMGGAYALKVPLTVDLSEGENWAETHK